MESKYKKMSDEELKELAKQRSKTTKCYTTVALRAQKELWERVHWLQPDDNTCTDLYQNRREISEQQYNG